MIIKHLIVATCFASC